MSRRFRRRRSRTCSIEHLEQRRVLAASLAADVWTIRGDDDAARPDDVIIVDVDPADAANLRARINGQVVGVQPAASIKTIRVSGGLGDDAIRIDVDRPGIRTVLDGGVGDDSIVGGAGPDTIFGKAGRDTVFGGGGNDEIRGGGGSDTLIGGGGHDLIRGGGGGDTLIGNAGKNRLVGGPGHDTFYGVANRDAAVLGSGERLDALPARPAPVIAAQPDDRGLALLDLISTATRSVDIIIFQIKDPRIASALLDRMAARVNVRLVLDASSGGNVALNSAFVTDLRDAMVARSIPAERLQAHWSSENFSITHQKSVIIDAVDATGTPLSADGLPFSARVLVSSGNFATTPQYGDYWKQRNFYVTVADGAVIAEAARVFVSDFKCDGRSVTNGLGQSSILVWSNGTTNRFIGEQGLYPSDGAYFPATEADWDTVSQTPRDEGNVVAYQVGLIEQARTGDVLRVYTLEFTSSIIITSLVHAAQRGVDVRLVTTYEDDNDRKKENLTNVAKAGATIQYFGPQTRISDVLYIHAKAMLLSRGDVFVGGFVGSQNFTDNSMLFNRELGIPLDADYVDVAARIQQSFDADFVFQAGTADLPYTARLTRANPSMVPAAWLGSSTVATTSTSFVRPGCGCVDHS